MPEKRARSRPKVLMIDAGGTIAQEPTSGRSIDATMPFDYLDNDCRAAIEHEAHLNYAFADGRHLNSSEYRASDWGRLAQQIYAAHEEFDGFVVAHGTATLSYAASLCSFMLADVKKPIVFTGAQVPLRRGLANMASDGFANLRAAVRIAAEGIVRDVLIVFGDSVLRGNRATKRSVAGWNAFRSPNFPALARVDASGICYLSSADETSPPTQDPGRRFRVDERVHVVPIHPALQATTLWPAGECRAIVVTGYLAGIVPRTFRDELRNLAADHLVVVGAQGELGPSARLGELGESLHFAADGIVWGGDMTLEALVMKTVWALAQEPDREAQRSLLLTNIAGELTV